MKTTTIDTATVSRPWAPGHDIVQIASRLLQGRESLEVALAAWREHHGLRLTDVSARIGRQPGAVSAMLHDPDRLPNVRRAVAELIGYEERAE